MIWFFTYMKNEFLTWHYGKEFIGLHKSSNMVDNVDYLKVISYSENSACIYYVGSSGDVFTFTKNNNEWEMLTWNTIWSKTGSADGFIYPYFWHSIEGIYFFGLVIILSIITICMLFLLEKLCRIILKNHTKS